MATAQAVWGIDVGRCALTAIKLRPEGDGKVEILAHDYVEHAKILSQPDAERHELIAAALEKFLSRNDISKDTVVLSVPGQQTLARFSKLPPVAEKKLPELVRYEADQQIPFDMDEVIWDYQTFSEEGMPDIEVGIFAMKRELIREHLLHFEQAAIEPIAVQPIPIALYNAALFDGVVGDETTVLLDIGADNTDLVVATKHGLWTRTIPIGGNNCTDALVKSFKLSFSKAEGLKRAAETSKYRRQIFQAMRPVFADLVQELQRSIGFYSSTHRDARIDRVFGVGNAFKLPGLQKYVQQNLGLTVECPKGMQKVANASTAVTGALAEQSLSFWAAYGLALHGAELARVAVNLLPVEIAKQVVWRKKRPAFAAAAACLVLAGGMVWFRRAADMSALAAGSEGVEQVSVTAQQARRIIDSGPSSSLSPRALAASIQQAGQSLKKELNALSGKGDDERAECEELIRHQQDKALVPKLLAVIHSSLPQSGGPLASAGTPHAYVEAISTAAVERQKRDAFELTALNIQYSDDVNNPLWPESLVDVEPRINDTDDAVPGFIITINGQTTNAGGREYAASALMDTLRKNGRAAGLGFYVDRVYMMSARQGPPQYDIADMAVFEGTTTRRRGTPRSAAGGPSLGAAKLDPLLDESMETDWQFEIWVDVILGEFPLTDDEPEDAEEDEGDE